MSELLTTYPETDLINTITRLFTSRAISATDALEQLKQANEAIPLDQAQQTIRRLLTAGILREQNGKIKPITLPKNTSPAQYLEQIEQAIKITQTLAPRRTQQSSWKESYDAVHAQSQSPVLIHAQPPQAKDTGTILYICELNFGYRWTTPRLAAEILSYYQKQADKNRPMICIISGLLFGEYRYQRKPLQENVIFDLNEQFRQANQFLSALKELGCHHIIINASDKEIGRFGSIATQLATDIYFYIKKRAAVNPTISSSATTNDSTFDQLYKDPLFAELRETARKIYLPYCLASGRTLYDSQQMLLHTNGACHHPEGVLLLEIHQALSAGSALPTSITQYLQTEAIPNLTGYSPQGWHYVDDHSLRITSPKLQPLQIVTKRRAGNTSDITLRTDTQAGLRYLVRSADETPTTHFYVETSQHQLLISQEGFQDYIVNTPGFTDAAPLRIAQGSFANTTDLAYRMQYLRKRNGVPGTFALKKNSDGSLEFQIATRNLIEKRGGKPTVLIQWNDWQIESDTHRPDLVAKYIARTQDVLLTAVQQDQDVVLVINGDIKQGVNFRGKQHAEPASRSGIDQQDTFLLELLQTSFAHFGFNPKLTQKKFTKALKKLQKVIILPGNHCWNSGFRDYGSAHMRSLVNFFEKLFLYAGIRPEDRVIAPDRVYSDRGDFYYWWLYNGQISGYQVMAQHDILDKGGHSGSKGANNGPIMQVLTQLQGLRDDMNIDFDLRGHWHRFQMATFPRSRHLHQEIPYTDGIVSIIAPAIAGGSTYEHRRGLRSYIGQIEIHLGGGYLPIVRLNTHQTLATYAIKHGYFSEENLRRIGYSTDPDYDPISSGFYASEGRQSALQKAIHYIRDTTSGPGTRSSTSVHLGRH